MVGKDQCQVKVKHKVLLSSQKRTRENLGNKVDGKRLPCDLLGMVWMPKSHEVKGLDVVNNKFETGCVASEGK